MLLSISSLAIAGVLPSFMFILLLLAIIGLYTTYRIKKNSAVVCGGIPVDLSHLPWPNETWKYIVGIVASFVVFVGVGYGLINIWPSPRVNIKSLQKQLMMQAQCQLQT